MSTFWWGLVLGMLIICLLLLGTECYLMLKERFKKADAQIQAILAEELEDEPNVVRGEN